MNPTLHDRPWNWGAMILKGGYYEHIPYNETTGNVVGPQENGVVPGHVRFRKADDLHWLELKKDENGNEILVGASLWERKKKEWGFVDFVKHKGYPDS